jgi:hypothetical protein
MARVLKAHTGVKSISYEDMIREALCFGWIDSLIKRLDDNRYALKVTPRRPTSKWSGINRKRWLELGSAGQLAPAGLAAHQQRIPTRQDQASPSFPPKSAKRSEQIPARGRTSGGSRPPAGVTSWCGFTSPSDRTRPRQLRESISLLAAGKKPGLK